MANYLYNGVELPELPEWDETAYPYALLVEWDGILGRDYRLVFSKDPYYWVESYRDGEYGHSSYSPCGVGVQGSPPPTVSEWWWFTEGEWQFGGHDDSAGGFSGTLPYIWSNYDLLIANENIVTDGSGSHTFAITDEVRYHASDPISLANQTVIEWDGDTTDRQSTTYNGLTYYKAAEAAPSIKQLKGGYTVTSSTAEELGTVLTTGANADYTYFEDGDIYGTAAWLVKDGAVWLYKYVEDDGDTLYPSILTYATQTATIKSPKSWWLGYQMGCAAREQLRK